MNGLDVSLILDGTPLPASRTAIKRFLNPQQFGFQVAYYFQQGQIICPTDLSVGTDRLDVTIVYASGQQTFQDGITFVIDDPAREPAPDGDPDGQVDVRRDSRWSWRPNVGENVVAAEGTVPTFRRIRRTWRGPLYL